MHKPAVCPDIHDYQELTSGQLAAETKESLLRHLEGCDSCVLKIQALPAEDTFVGWIQQVKTLSGGPEDKQLAPLIQRLIQLRQAGAAPVKPVAARTFAFSCPGCGKSLRVKEEAAGKKVKCPHCGQVAQTPAAVPRGGEVKATLTGQETGLFQPSESIVQTQVAASSRDQKLCGFLAPAQAPDELGRLGPYRVLKVLGAGGMGVVFRAEDPQLQRLVALKAMLPDLAANESARQRFLREARAAAKLKHDHIVTIFQVGEDRGAPFLAMEFLEGEALEDRIKRAALGEGSSPLPLAEIVRIGREIAEGLQAAHEHGLIHRDIKPGNIWLEGKRGRVKILDFGLARSANEDVHLTQSGAIVGTPAYMPPEQARGEAVDGRCDLYSLGCVLYRLCTGELPFKGENTMSLLLALATEQPKSVRELNADVPPALADLIMRLLAKDAAQRPATAREVADALSAIDIGEPVVVKAARAPAPPRRRRRLVAAVAGGALVLAALLTVIVIRLGKPEEGTVTIETDDPDVELVFTGGGRDFVVKDKKSREKIKLPLGSYQVVLKGGKDGLKLETNEFTLTRGDRKLVKVTWQAGARANIAAPVQVPKPPLRERPSNPQAGEPWVVYEGSSGPGQGKHVVLISGDEEYRSEEALPQLGKILAGHHGFKCTVLFSVDPKNGTINPDQNDNIPGLEHLEKADLMILFTRLRNLPDQQMRHIAEYVEAGKPIIGLRTATHAFDLKSKTYGKYSWMSNEEWQGGFGRQILGATWVDHWGNYGSQSTRGLLAPGAENHPILRGIKVGDIWGPTDVYEVHLPLPGDSKPLVLGQILKGMKPNDPPADGPDARKNNPMMPIAWTKTYQSATNKTGRVFTTTMGASQDLESEGLRRLLINAAYWAVGMEDKIAANAKVAIVGDYKPLPFGNDGYKKGVRPTDLAEAKPSDPMQIPEPPPLAEWLKGRTVLTVAQDGSGQFKTIKAALDALKPHQVVKVLDRGSYRERLQVGTLPDDTGLISERQTVIESPAEPADAAPEWELWFGPLEGFRLSGLHLLARPRSVEKGGILFFARTSGVVLENCCFSWTKPIDGAAALGFHFDDNATEFKPIVVRNCLFDNAGLLFGRQTGRTPPMLIERNYFHKAIISGDGPCFQTVVIRHNVFDFPTGVIWIQKLKEVRETFEISNNTSTGSPKNGFPSIVQAAPKRGIIVRNNISETALSFDGGDEVREDALKNWQLDHNCYMRRGPLPKAASDVAVEAQFLSVDPKHPDYLRIAVDSPLGKGGAGGVWPSYLGALPPGPAPKDGDWFTRLREKWRKDKPAADKKP